MSVVKTKGNCVQSIIEKVLIEILVLEFRLHCILGIDKLILVLQTSLLPTMMDLIKTWQPKLLSNMQ